MPGISHVVYGLATLLPLVFVARDRLDAKAAAVYVFNNWIGPDSFWPYSVLPFPGHSILGFVAWAVPLAWIYQYLSRFSLHRRGRWFELRDDGEPYLEWRHAYALTVAGGFSHFFVDAIGHHGYLVHLWEGLSPSFDEVQAWGDAYYHVTGAVSLVGYLVQLGACFLTLHYAARKPKDFVAFLASLVGATLLVVATLGGEAFGELEISTQFLVGTFFIVPFTLLGWALGDLARRGPDKKGGADAGVKLRMHLGGDAGRRKLVGIGALFGSLSGALVLLSTLGWFRAGAVADEFGVEATLVRAGAAGVGVLSGLLLVGAFAMAGMRADWGRKLVARLSCALAAFAFPLVLGLALCTDEARAATERRSPNVPVPE
ncbi:MAG: hypothetical protein Kow0069_24630 [Promethearchaeota archaeon]